MNKPDKETLAKWRKMTDENDHSAVRVEIAKWYANETGNDNYNKAFEYVLDEHDKNGSLCSGLDVVRYLLTEAMMNEIAQIDRGAAYVVDNCL